MSERRPTVGVMGSGSDPHQSRADQIGELLASLGVNLLTGGGGGVMESVSRAFARQPSRRGRVIGVLPADSEGPGHAPRHGYPNRWIEIVIATHLPLSGERGEEALSRNHINILSSDVVVLLPGSAGTLSEARLALRYRKPVVAFFDSTWMPDLPQEIPRASDLDELRTFLARALGA